MNGVISDYASAANLLSGAMALYHACVRSHPTSGGTISDLGGSSGTMLFCGNMQS